MCDDLSDMEDVFMESLRAYYNVQPDEGTREVRAMSPRPEPDLMLEALKELDREFPAALAVPTLLIDKVRK